MQVDDAHDIAVVMRMYQSIEYSDSYSKTSAILWQYCKDEATLNDDDATDGLTAANTITDSLKIKEILDKEDFEVMVPSEYLSKCWRTLDMSLINCEINLDLN